MGAFGATERNQTPNSSGGIQGISLWEISSMDKRETAQTVE
jgi:hypothetical protein